jgi:hypothetical protein
MVAVMDKRKFVVVGAHTCDEHCIHAPELTLPVQPDHWLRFDKGLTLDQSVITALHPIREAIDSAIDDVAELRALDAMIAATKARCLALAEAAQRLHDKHDAISTVCPLAQDLLAAAALL